MIDDAVILAAGKGTRLRQTDDALPKPLTVVGGMPLIKRTILTLGKAGVRRVVVVTGFMADQVRATVTGDAAYGAAGIEIAFAHNPEFELANGVSVMVGGAACNGPSACGMASRARRSATSALMKAPPPATLRIAATSCDAALSFVR